MLQSILILLFFKFDIKYTHFIHKSLLDYMIIKYIKGDLIMDNENRYEPYQYGTPQKPQDEKPDFEVKEDEVSGQNQPEDNHDYTPRYDYNYSTPEPQKKPEKSKKTGVVGKVVAIVVVAIVFGVVAAGVYQGTNRIINKFFGEVKGEQESTNDGPIDNTEITTNKGNTVVSDVADVAEKVMPSVVSITNMSIQEVQNFFFGGVTQYESKSSGSGIIIGQNKTELLIVTNKHVVESSKELTVSFIDGKSANAQIKGTDSDMDLAIIVVPLNSIASETKGKIKTATLGDSTALRVGEPTIAIGNALGYGQSVTSGIVSALNRTIEGYEGQLIQTDAAINPGNSGGALLNANGEVIGINTIKVNADAVEGMGYAIPISDATDILNNLMNKQTRTKVPESQRGSIGIKGRTVEADMAKLYNMPRGVYVAEVIQGGGADQAKLPVECVITKIDGNSINSMEELQEELQYYRAGETVKFTIKVPSRNGYQEETIDIKLGRAN